MTHGRKPVTRAVARADGAARITVPAKRGRPYTRKTSGLRERAWWLMRKLPRFTIDDLLFTLADGGEQDAPGNLTKYVRALERVGVLSRLMRRAPGNTPTSNGHVIWRLARDLGRTAPVWRSASQQLFDPNTGGLIGVVAAAGPHPSLPQGSQGGPFVALGEGATQEAQP